MLSKTHKPTPCSEISVSALRGWLMDVWWRSPWECCFPRHYMVTPVTAKSQKKLKFIQFHKHCKPIDSFRGKKKKNKTYKQIAREIKKNVSDRHFDKTLWAIKKFFKRSLKSNLCVIRKVWHFSKFPPRATEAKVFWSLAGGICNLEGDFDCRSHTCASPLLLHQ